MIHRAAFENFRGLRSLTLQDMENITLISGRNNSGKSSILEGIYLALNYKDAGSFILLNNIRGISYSMKPSELWGTLFYNLSQTEKMRINLLIDDLELKLKYYKDDNSVPNAEMNQEQNIIKPLISSEYDYNLAFDFSCGDYEAYGRYSIDHQNILSNVQHKNLPLPFPHVQYIHSSRVINNDFIAELFGKIMLKNKKDQLIENLKLIDSSLNDITTITSGTQSQLYANISGQWLPLRLAGDGFDHMILLLSSIMAYPDSLLLVDEIETGFHYSVCNNLWKILMNAAKEENCQIIATTHSYECIKSAAEEAGAAGLHNGFCYFRLEHAKDGGISAHRFSQEILEYAVHDNLEVR